MPSETGNVRYVVWSELFGWFFLLVRALRLSLKPSKLLVATLAVFLTTVGWGAIAYVFSDSDNESVKTLSNQFDDWPWTMGESENRTVSSPLSEAVTAHVANPLDRGWATMTAPFRQVFAGGQTLQSVVLSLLLGFWAIFVWGLFGGVIGRMAAVELATGERYSLGRAISFARKKWPSYVAAPLVPMSVVFIATLMMGLLGVIMQYNIGVLLAATVWPLVLTGCALLVFVLIGLAFGWPLMWGTISTEGTDAFDALARAYAYTTQRPLHYLFYAAVASLLGVLGLALVAAFTSGVINLSDWGVGWGGGRVAEGEVNAIGNAGMSLLAFWIAIVKLIAVGFVYSYLWTSTTAIYLLLRRDVDATELDEAYLEDEPTGEGLAALVTDEAGVPGVADTPSDKDNEDNGDDVDEE